MDDVFISCPYICHGEHTSPGVLPVLREDARAFVACDVDGLGYCILVYNYEISLAFVLTVAYIWVRNEYVIHREYATGKGYADLVMIPRRNVNKPALVIELKFNNTADTAIDQIKRKQYPAKIAEYTGDILLVGINYDRETKLHTCRIERYGKNEN